MFVVATWALAPFPVIILSKVPAQSNAGLSVAVCVSSHLRRVDECMGCTYREVSRPDNPSVLQDTHCPARRCAHARRSQQPRPGALGVVRLGVGVPPEFAAVAGRVLRAEAWRHTGHTLQQAGSSRLVSAYPPSSLAAGARRAPRVQQQGRNADIACCV